MKGLTPTNGIVNVRKAALEREFQSKVQSLAKIPQGGNCRMLSILNGKVSGVPVSFIEREVMKQKNFTKIHKNLLLISTEPT